MVILKGILLESYTCCPFRLEPVHASLEETRGAGGLKPGKQEAWKSRKKRQVEDKEEKGKSWRSCPKAASDQELAARHVPHMSDTCPVRLCQCNVVDYCQSVQHLEILPKILIRIKRIYSLRSKLVVLHLPKSGFI